ncbi:MAG: IS481 family transposase [Terriglobales bacterium]
MPWKDYEVTEERWRFIEDWNSEDFSMTELCEHYEVTRKTGYKWLRRYQAAGLEGLRDASREPHRHPNQVSGEMEERVLALRERHPRWGAPKIRGRLLLDHRDQTIPAASTIGGILKRNGLTVALRRRQRSRGGEQPLAEADGPNSIWCTDFKGWFRTQDGARIDALTISDQYSRYLFRCQALAAADYLHSKVVLEAVFREYGLPQRLRTDNGAPFGSNGESGLTGLTVWWIKLGIVPEHIQAGKPQQNGRHERMHRTLQQETASPPAANRRAQQARFDLFRQEYNEQRPHQALGQRPPAQVYQPSTRVYPTRLSEVAYPAGWTLRRIAAGGEMKWAGQKVFVAHPLQGETVGLEQIDDRYWRVWFSFHQIGVLDTVKVQIRRPRPGGKKPEDGGSGPA